jgi:hypothetical protein
MALRAGVNPKIVSTRLGHATVAFTLDTYTADVPELDRSAAEQITGPVPTLNRRGRRAGVTPGALTHRDVYRSVYRSGLALYRRQSQEGRRPLNLLVRGLRECGRYWDRTSDLFGVNCRQRGR